MALPLTPNKNRQLRRYTMKANETPVEGGIALVEIASGTVVVAGADPALIAGFFTSPDPASLSFDPYPGDVLIWLAYPGSTFWMEGTSAPVAANVGNKYGIGVSSEVAIVDITDTTALRLLVEDIDTDWNLFEVSVLAANRQLQP